MGKLSKNQIMGVILLVAAILIWAPLPFLSGTSSIGTLAVVIVGLYQLFVK